MKIQRKCSLDAADWCAVVALVLIGFGCWLIYPPASFISVGVLILVLTFLVPYLLRPKSEGD